MHTTSQILMIRPVSFTYNTETAVNNAFQQSGREINAQQYALKEFDFFVSMLRKNNIDVLVINDTAEPNTPDSIFPNNWISFHADGTVVLYPMYAGNRRLERKPLVLAEIRKKFMVRTVLDLSLFEEQHQFLEGTGSLVLDRDKNIAYACLSPRTNEKLVLQFCKDLFFHAVIFEARDSLGNAIYHTNVLMCVADKYVVICLEAITDPDQQERIIQTIKNSGKELIAITLSQMNHFAGNMLQVNTVTGKKLLVMSAQAYESLNSSQITRLLSYNELIYAPLNTIETNGGGSARCMMAEIHLPIQK